MPAAVGDIGGWKDQGLISLHARGVDQTSSTRPVQYQRNEWLDRDGRNCTGVEQRWQTQKTTLDIDRFAIEILIIRRTGSEKNVWFELYAIRAVTVKNFMAAILVSSETRLPRRISSTVLPLD